MTKEKVAELKAQVKALEDSVRAKVRDNNKLDEQYKQRLAEYNGLREKINKENSKLGEMREAAMELKIHAEDMERKAKHRLEEISNAQDYGREK